MKLRSLTSHCRKNSVGDEVIGKKWIYVERNTLYGQSVGHLRRQERPRNVVWLAFMGWVISSTNEWEGYSNYFGEGVKISRNGPTAFWFLMIGLETVMMLMGVLFSGWCVRMSMLYWGPRSSGSQLFPKSSQFLSCPQGMSFCSRLWPTPFPPVSLIIIPTSWDSLGQQDQTSQS